MWVCEDVSARERKWRCGYVKMWRWADVKMRRCEDEQMWRWADVKMSRCEDEKVWRWEDVKMRRCERRCEDEKMRYRPPLLEEPCAQTLSGKMVKIVGKLRETDDDPWGPIMDFGGIHTNPSPRALIQWNLWDHKSKGQPVRRGESLTFKMGNGCFCFAPVKTPTMHWA